MDLKTVLQVGAVSEDIGAQRLAATAGQGIIVTDRSFRGCSGKDNTHMDIAWNRLVQDTIQHGKGFCIAGEIPEKDGTVYREQYINTRVRVALLRTRDERKSNRTE